MKFVVILISIFSALAIVGCGAQDAIDSTIDMNKKMDATNSKVGKTNEQIEVTNHAIHKQTLVVALDNMLKESNTKYLLPPVGMLPGGKAFAEEATPHELMELTYAWMREIDSAMPDPVLTLGMSEEEVIAKTNRDKLIKFIGVQIIAGVTPQEKVEEVIKEQIDQNGRHQFTAFAWLAARAKFTETFLLNEGLLGEKMVALGQMEQAAQYIEQLEFVLNLPFNDQIRWETFGFLGEDQNKLIVLDMGTARMWKKVSRALSKFEEAKTAGSVEENDRVKNLRKRIERYYSL